MKMQRKFVFSALFVVSCVVLLNCAAQAQKKAKYVCDEPNPANLCTAANTCGSASAACNVDVLSVRGNAVVKPEIPGAKNNQLFCVKKGTSVVWLSTSKSVGFMIYFGTDSPFDPDEPIMGGGSKKVTVKAATPGCYKYDAGAFVSGATYGMGAGSKPELVILP